MTSTTESSLEVRNAQRFWRHASAGTMEARLLLGDWSRLVADPALRTDTAAWTQQVEKVLSDRGFFTTMDAIHAARDDAFANDRGFWSGAYTLISSAGAVYQLDVYVQTARLRERVTGKVWVLDAPMKNSAIAIDLPDLQGALSFNTPLRSQPDDVFELVAPDRTEFHCTGALTRGPKGASRAITLQGKRNSYTPEGAASPTDGDPLAAWAGNYTLGALQDGEWAWLDGALSVDGEHATPAFARGNVAATDVQYVRNTLTGRIQGQRWALFFQKTKSGDRRLTVFWEDQGEYPWAFGFWTAIAHDHTALYRHALSPDGSQPVYVVPGNHRVSSTAVLDAGKAVGAGDRLLVLPTAVEKNDYLVEFHPFGFDGPPPSAEAPYRWTIGDRGTLPEILAVLDPSDDVGTYGWFQATPGETQHAGQYEFVVNVSRIATDSTPALSLDFRVRLPVSSTPTLSLTPADLPPIVRRAEYNVLFSASGGSAGSAANTITLAAGARLPGSLRWADAAGNARNGWPASAPSLTGKVGLQEAQRSYSVQLEVSPGPERVQNPLVETRTLTVIEKTEPIEEVRGLGWLNLIAGWVTAGGVILSGIYFLYKFHRRKKANADTPDAPARDTADSARANEVVARTRLSLSDDDARMAVEMDALDGSLLLQERNSRDERLAAMEERIAELESRLKERVAHSTKLADDLRRAQEDGSSEEEVESLSEEFAEAEKDASDVASEQVEAERAQEESESRSRHQKAMEGGHE